MARNSASGTRLRDLLAECHSFLAARERDLLVEKGLCQSDLAALLRLSKKGPAPVNRLAEKVGLTSGSMTSAVQRMEKAGFVTRTRQEKDKRVVLVEITGTGASVAKAAIKKREALLDPHFDSLSSRERQIMEGLLKKVRKSAKPD